MKLKFGIALAASIALSPSFATAQDKGTIRLGIEIPVSIVNVPMLIALDRLKADGYTVSTVDFQSPETMALALQNGEVDLIGTSAGTAFSAIDAGFKGKAMLGLAMSDFLMVAKTGLADCASLDGKNIGVQSRDGTTGVLTARWLESECPGAKPNVLIVPGSENRVAGLIAGQLDASPIDSQNTAQLMALRPGTFTPIESFSKASVLASVYVASDAWMADHKAAATALAATYDTVVKEASADKTEFLARTTSMLADTDPAIVEAVVTGYLDRGVLVPVAGIQPGVIEDAIKFYSSARPYASIKVPDDVASTEFVSGLSK